MTFYDLDGVGGNMEICKRLSLSFKYNSIFEMGILGNIISDFKQDWDEGRRESRGYNDENQYNDYYDESPEKVDDEYALGLLREARRIRSQMSQIYQSAAYSELLPYYQRCKELMNEYASYGLYYKSSAYNFLGWLEYDMGRAMWRQIDALLSKFEENPDYYSDEDLSLLDSWENIPDEHYDSGLFYAEEAAKIDLQLENYSDYRYELDLKAAICIEVALCLGSDKDKLSDVRRISTFLMAASEENIRADAKERYRWVTDKWLELEENGMSKIANETFNKPEKRRYIFFARDENSLAGCFDEENNIPQMFTLDKYPIGYTFPMSHPQANTLYVAHPVKQGYYLPYDGAEDKIFKDKVDDFIRMVQCLGATEINFRSLSGRSVSENYGTGYDGEFNYHGTVRSGGINSDGSRSKNYSRTTSMEIGHSRKFDPVRPPYCPDDILWLDYDSSWQNLVKQRLDGNILEYTMRISSEDAMSTNSNQKLSVKASYEGLMRNVDANFNSERDTTFSSSESTLWEISVVFKSLKDFPVENDAQQVVAIEAPETESVPQVELTEAEQMYIDELNFMLEDGAIGDAERRLLERKRAKFGISEARAAELEALVAPALTDDEIEYIEIFKEVCTDGEVTPRIRKMLDREADDLGISSERAVELEVIAKGQ